MDHAGSFRCARSGGNGPGTGLLRASGEKGQKIEKPVSSPDQSRQPGLLQPQLAQKFGLVRGLKLDNLGFDRRRHGDMCRSLGLGMSGNSGGMGVAGRGFCLIDIADIQNRL